MKYPVFLDIIYKVKILYCWLQPYGEEHDTMTMSVFRAEHDNCVSNMLSYARAQHKGKSSIYLAPSFVLEDDIRGNIYSTRLLYRFNNKSASRMRRRKER